MWHYFTFSRRAIFQSILIISLLNAISFSHATTSSLYSFHQIVNLSNEQTPRPQWLNPLANPSDKQQYYLADKSGKIYIAQDGEIHPQPIFNLATHTQPEDEESVTLTSITLHPDFAYSDQVGYGTFYTAHTSKRVKNSKTKRLQIRQADINYQYDAVITEWQFNQLNHTKVDVSSKREIVRISLINQENHIPQLAFNPFKKSWNDDYGLLYFSLLPEDTLSTYPLYSGVILRINPKKFGLKEYTVPTNNPFLKDIEINDEIFLLGAQKIKQFLWPQKNSEQLSVVHNYDQQNIFSTAEHRSDWRSTPPREKAVIEENISNILLYKGRALKSLRKRLIYLTKESNQWLLNTHQSANPTNTAEKVQTNLDSSEQLNTDELLLFSDSFGELLLLDNTNSVISKITHNNPSGELYDENQQTSNNGIFIFISLITALSILVISQLKKGKKGLSSLVRRNYADIEVSQSKLQVGLYRRHQTASETVLTINQIESSEIFLNNTSISLINHEKGFGFSDAQELDLRENFAREYKDKMIDDKVRQICLVLRNQAQDYRISLYARKGDQRVTKKRYKEVIEEIIDWCWLVARSINSESTGKRTPRPALKSTAPQTVLKKSAIKKNKQAAIEKVKATMSKSASLSDDTIETPQKSIKTSPPTKSTNDPISKKDSLIDTELVNALDKLVKLKQQGFLTSDEFNQAKDKLLKDLMH